MKKRKKQMAWLFLTCMAIMFLPMTAFAKDVKLSFKASTSTDSPVPFWYSSMRAFRASP